MNTSQKRGRTLLSAALLVLAALIFSGFIASLSKGQTDLPDGIIGNAFLLLILVLAFRGGRLPMNLTKGCAVVFLAIVAVLGLVMAISLVRGIPLPSAPTVENTIPVVATIVGVVFSTWALFLSKDVDAFVGYRREAAFQKQLQKIKRN